ncbi:hypothetical protein O6H91_14G023400 [Diphasiastrum complanatum]|uniref:Uncharacterized protein n=1 Tax=Diphasiastrum complanatum TaxID=34168 RepID=A0ACC2BMB1_DIPCM|nr:hypothetical protein O6H91_Y510100 [Diphasiastrum complanatum]KAJ7530884.1 hypothetical protein O6H91_14G023400 [Diphasiastrum complanatum]
MMPLMRRASFESRSIHLSTLCVLHLISSIYKTLSYIAADLGAKPSIMTASGAVDDDQHQRDNGSAPPTYYGTFQGNPNFPQPVPPSEGPHYAPASGPAYQPVQGHPISGEAPRSRGVYIGHDRLPFCGIGVGWFLFIIGFFCVSIPWFIGSFIYFCVSHDVREHAGLAACTIAALIALVLGTAKGVSFW